MSLKSRLTRLQEQAGRHPVTQSVPLTTASSLRSRLTNLRPERVQGRPVATHGRMSGDKLAEHLQGEWLGEGLMKIEASLPLSSDIGDTSLSGLKHSPLLPGEAHAKPGLYIDTETTGLAGGSGTLAFLVGIACIREDSIRLCQYLITSFAAEAAMLREVEAMLSHEHRLVSYNGKTYDVPLLQTRFRMQGMRSSISELDHLDLLHPVRRLFAKHWHNCRLGTAEQRLLNFHRRDDLPGAEAPEAWFAYLRSGHGERLIKVVEHNRQDILSLPAIHQRLMTLTQDPAPHEMDMVGYGRWLLEVDEPRALRMLQRVQEYLTDDGQRLLAYLLRRAQRWPEAVAIWERLAQFGCVESIERLAKYHEHVSRDLEAAWLYCARLSNTPADEHRRRRLRKKLQDQSTLKRDSG